MNRGQFLFRASIVLMFFAGMVTAPLLKALTTMSPLAIFSISILAGFAAFVIFGVIVSKLGY